MRNEFYKCEKHTSYWRKKAIDAMPWALKVVAVVGGYTGAVLYCRMPQKAVDKIKTSAKEQNLAVGDYLIKRLGL